MKIYFAAHATTVDNEAKIASGWKDVELSELGIKQAHELGEIFKDIKLDLICTSDLKRAVDSVKIAFKEKYQIIIDARLRELNYGDFNGKPSEVVEKMKIKHINKPFPNGESYEQAVARAQEFYNELKIKNPNSLFFLSKCKELCLNIELYIAPRYHLNLCLINPFNVSGTPVETFVLTQQAILYPCFFKLSAISISSVIFPSS